MSLTAFRALNYSPSGLDNAPETTIGAAVSFWLLRPRLRSKEEFQAGRSGETGQVEDGVAIAIYTAIGKEAGRAHGADNCSGLLQEKIAGGAYLSRPDAVESPGLYFR